MLLREPNRKWWLSAQAIFSPVSTQSVRYGNTQIFSCFDFSCLRSFPCRAFQLLCFFKSSVRPLAEAPGCSRFFSLSSFSLWLCNCVSGECVSHCWSARPRWRVPVHWHPLTSLARLLPLLFLLLLPIASVHLKLNFNRVFGGLLGGRGQNLEIKTTDHVYFMTSNAVQ